MLRFRTFPIIRFAARKLTRVKDAHYMDQALREEVIVAYSMNGQALPLLNGFPVRLVVPGWYATY